MAAGHSCWRLEGRKGACSRWSVQRLPYGGATQTQPYSKWDHESIRVKELLGRPFSETTFSRCRIRRERLWAHSWAPNGPLWRVRKLRNRAACGKASLSTLNVGRSVGRSACLPISLSIYLSVCLLSSLPAGLWFRLRDLNCHISDNKPLYYGPAAGCGRNAKGASLMRRRQQQ